MSNTEARTKEIQRLRRQKMTRPKIAALLGVCVGTVDNALYRARTTPYERKATKFVPEGFKERPCLSCGVMFQAPIQKGRTLYFRCATHREDS